MVPKQSMNGFARAAMVALVLLTFAVSAYGSTPQPVIINNVAINYTNNQLTIDGSGFDPAAKAPTVNFNGANLTLVSFTNNVVVAKLPAGTTAGTYQLNVTNSQGLLLSLIHILMSKRTATTTAR